MDEQKIEISLPTYGKSKKEYLVDLKKGLITALRMPFLYKNIDVDPDPDGNLNSLFDLLESLEDVDVD